MAIRRAEPREVSSGMIALWSVREEVVAMLGVQSTTTSGGLSPSL
jgi:hypothetical protein